jgi:tetratricopeptide (TPR) repeat protein
MKVFREIFLSILIGLSILISGVTCTQRPAKESYSRGVEHAIQGKFRKAKEEFEKALKIDPFYSPAKHSLAIIKDAIEQKIKTETAIHLFKGVYSANKGDNDLAIAYYNMAIVNDPKYAEAYINRGIAYHHKGQSDLAIREYNKAIEINPDDAEAYYNRGVVYDNKGHHDLAIRDYNRAIEINPKDAEAYINRGFVYLVESEGKGRGCADLKKACELGMCGKYNLVKQKGYCL